MKHRVYTHLLEPREHPDYDRRPVRPPSWETFGNRTQFTSLRSFAVENDVIVKYVEEIEKYTKTFDLGNVLWPSYPIVFAKNLGDLADEIKRRGLFLFDIWGYVPGSGPGGYWQQYGPPASVFEMLESKLGDHWLGMDIGEQDGRYIGGYASQMFPVSTDRVAQYLNFQRHFERMGDELGNKLATLVSLNYGHYFLKEGTYTCIGAETAQGLPNSQVYYAFIRGAGKQYGVPWFGNASIFNRWGYKTYGSEGPDHSPTKGTSLNLLKRLLYSHILYNCLFVGFEAGHFESDQLSPIGRVQQAAHRWVQQYGPPGVMHAPVALLLDFFSGWTFPRHLYTGEVYRVWGNLPYEEGDFLTDALLDLLYPGYQDSSYFHDESGFMTATPYGDIADCLLSDAPLWVLLRYPVLLVAGALSADAETGEKLARYVETGGHLVITAGNMRRVSSAFPGATIHDKHGLVGTDCSVQLGSNPVKEECPFKIRRVDLPSSANVLARCEEGVLAAEWTMGEGTVTLFTSDFGIPDQAVTNSPIPSEIDKPLPKPYPLLKHVRTVMDGILRTQVLFEAGGGLSLITCRKAPGEYTLGVCNNSLQPRPFSIISHCGPVESITELPLDQSEKRAIGYFPEGFEKAEVGVSNPETIAGGDVRIFSVKLREEHVEEIPHIVPPPRPRGRVLPLRGLRLIKEDVLSRPTFFEHFDGVMVDWKYLHQREKDALKAEAGWLKRQGLRVYVDVTSGLNLYPDLRLVNNDQRDYDTSMAAIDDVLNKMEVLGSRDLILSLHRAPENNFTAEQTRASFERALREIGSRAAARDTAVYLRVCPKGPDNLDEAKALLGRVAAPNLSLAPSTALLARQRATETPAAQWLASGVGLWMVDGPSPNGRLDGYNCSDTFPRLLSLAPNAPMVLDAVYPDKDGEYLDVSNLERLVRK